MTTYKVVVDGSNIATEGRSLPSLNQLDEAVQSFVEEHPGAEVLVIVDTSFAHRVDPKEAQVFESAYEAGEIIMPPAGTIGRGDSFILKVADKLGATVFSNDSFQEFHGTYDWLFDRGRLIGGKPVPGLGWVFMDRTPVRGPKSREAVREAKRSQVRIGSKEAMRPMPVPKAPPTFAAKPVAASSTRPVSAKTPRSSGRAVLESETEGIVEQSSARRGRRDRRRGKGRDQVVGQTQGTDDSADTAASTAVKATPANTSSSKRPEFARKQGEPINEPLAFISFVAEHGIGTLVEGEIESYSSHGFYVTVAGARGYSPLHGLADPMPKSAKEVVRRGETHSFIVASFDAERRGIQLALIGSPAAAVVPPAPVAVSAKKAAAKKAAAKKAAVKKAAVPKAVAKSPTKAPAKPKAATEPKVKAIAKPKAAAPTKVPTKVTAAKSKATKAAPAKKVPVKTVPVKATATKAAPAKAATATQSRPAKATPAKVAKTVPVKAGAVKAVPKKALVKAVAVSKKSGFKATPAKALPTKAKPVKAVAAVKVAKVAKTSKAVPAKTKNAAKPKK